MPSTDSSQTLAMDLEICLESLRNRRLEEHFSSVYIPLFARPNLQACDSDVFPLMDKAQIFLTSERQVMLILGDAGSGKSTFLRHLERTLWTNYKKGGAIPLLVNLPAIDQPELGMVTKQLKMYNFDTDQIQELKEQRQFVLICDGYDENQLTINFHRTNKLNQKDELRAKMVVSCRTQFLAPDYQNRFVPQSTMPYQPAQLGLYQEAIIAPFSKEQIKDYVTCYVALEPRVWVAGDYMQVLTTTPNVMDLAKDPFLLAILLGALPSVTEGQLDLTNIPITRAELYDNLVHVWFDANLRRLQGGRTSNDDSSRLALAIYDEQDGNSVVQYNRRCDKMSGIHARQAQWTT
ncbi:hypothetical protein BGW39_004558 [Mortierella sp. 14UC]|nr:hypothetical protein BGW39_004558 [Mortierella sp. 14UC]